MAGAPTVAARVAARHHVDRAEVPMLQLCLCSCAIVCGLAAFGLPGRAIAADPVAPARSFQDPALQWGDCPDFMPEGCAISVVHGDPAGEESDVFFRVPAKAEIPLHWHSEAERMVLVDGRLSVRYDGQAPVTLTPGTYAYGPARLAHSATCESAQPCVLFIAFDGPVDAHAGRSAAE
jgi:quercetin dioxygenase-like cupin family protein